MSRYLLDTLSASQSRTEPAPLARGTPHRHVASAPVYLKEGEARALELLQAHSAQAAARQGGLARVAVRMDERRAVNSSCAQIHAQFPAAPSGVQTISPGGGACHTLHQIASHETWRIAPCTRRW